VLHRPNDLNLSNWRKPGKGHWAFHHVREVIPNEAITCAENSVALVREINADIAGLDVSGLDGAEWSLQRWLDESSSDALLVVGSSLMVFSGFRFVREACQQGIPVAAINRGRTRADELLQHKFDVDCALVLKQLLRELDPQFVISA